MREKNGKKMHYAWKIMIACILLKLGTGGAVAATVGNFVTPIVQELGCEVSKFTMLVSIEAVSMALLYTFAAKMLITKPIGLVMGIATLAETVGVLLMATYQSVYMFYVSGVIIGVAQAFTGLVAIPIVINMWFRKKAGTVLGIVIAVSSASTMAYGLLSAQLITMLGWRNAYLVLGLMCLIISVPAAFFLIRTPEQVGVKPYGEDGEVENVGQEAALTGEWGFTKKEAFHMPMLYLAWMACLCFSIGSGVSGYIQTFSTMEMGQSINFGAQAGMLMSLGGIACSLILGRINDRFGVKAGLIWGAVFTGLGYGLMLLSYRNPLFIMVGAMLVGLGSSMYQVQCPLLARSVIGNKHYSEIWAVMMVANSLIGGGLYSSIGLFYDKLGSYRGAFIMAAVLYVAALILGFVAIDMSRRKQKGKVIE